MNLKTAYRSARRFVTAEMVVSKPVIRFGSYFFPSISAIWWMLGQLYGAEWTASLCVITAPMLYCLFANGAMTNNGAIGRGRTCPYCGGGVLRDTYCSLAMTERYRFTCGTIGIIKGMTGISDYMGRQCLLNQAALGDSEEEDII